MQYNIKRIAILIYIISGCIWSIINLPNLMNRGKGNVILVVLLGTARILFWPVFILMFLYKKYQEFKVKDDDESEIST